MIGKVLGDRYEIIEKIGGGGMALVYKARCKLLNRFVAVKILRTEFTEDEEFVKKFKREAQSAASLSHPNIVGIYDVGKEDSIHYIVMEYVKGQTLKDLIRSKGSLNNDLATNIAIQMSSAIEHAHKNHIVHRDIKSHNILIREDNSVKVTDFGIARAVSSCTITNTGNIIGSVHYFSPEQARGGYTDEKSDIYSLGVVLYEMVTGRLPFEGESPIAIALKHIQEQPVKPRQLDTRIPRSVEDIILKCMEKDSSSRYDNAGQIIADLRQSLVMPNGSFVKRNRNYTDENTKVLEPIKINTADFTGDQNRQRVITAEASNVTKTEVKGETRSKNKNKVFATVAIASGLVLALAVFGIIAYVNSLITVKEVLVPDITNFSEEEAKEKLNEVGLFMEVAERVHSLEVPEGMIIRQIPGPLEKNKVTNPVKVIISKGATKVNVPNLIGENYEKVKLILEREGLEEGDLDSQYHEFPSGIVINQSYPAGALVDQGTSIDYVISMGPEKFQMPDYIGKTLDEVKSDLLQKELILQNKIEDYSNQYAAGIVINQSIKPGTEVSRNAVVDLVVSLGKEPEKPKKNLSVPLPSSIPYNTKVTVYMIKNGDSEKIYDDFYREGDENPLLIPVSGQGVVEFEVFLNGSLYQTYEHNFDQ